MILKNFNKTIDKILQIAPDFKDTLIPLKIKYKKYPKRKSIYWKQLFDILNKNLSNHPQWNDIKLAVISSKKTTHMRYSFPEAQPGESGIGVIPEYISDKLKKYDREMIALGKYRVEAQETRDKDMIAKCLRRDSIQELKMKRLWLRIKDHFNIWYIDHSYKFTVKRRDGILILCSEQLNHHPSSSGPPGSPMMPFPGGGNGMIMQMNPEILKKLMDMMGFNPPPGFFPDPDNES